MVEESWGQKHLCHACRARFYDLLRHPVVCPRCGARIELPGDGSARRPPVASDLEAAAVLARVAPNGGGIVEAQVPVALATDDDVLAEVAIDDDSRELDDPDGEDEDSADDRIEGSDAFEIDVVKDASLDDEEDDEDSPDDDEEEPDEVVDADTLEDETEDDGDLDDDDALDEELDGDELNELDDGGGDDADETELGADKEESDANGPKPEAR